MIKTAESYQCGQFVRPEGMFILSRCKRGMHASGSHRDLIQGGTSYRVKGNAYPMSQAFNGTWLMCQRDLRGVLMPSGGQ